MNNTAIEGQTRTCFKPPIRGPNKSFTHFSTYKVQDITGELLKRKIPPTLQQVNKLGINHLERQGFNALRMPEAKKIRASKTLPETMPLHAMTFPALKHKQPMTFPGLTHKLPINLPASTNSTINRSSIICPGLMRRPYDLPEVKKNTPSPFIFPAPLDGNKKTIYFSKQVLDETMEEFLKKIEGFKKDIQRKMTEEIKQIIDEVIKKVQKEEDPEKIRLYINAWRLQEINGSRQFIQEGEKAVDEAHKTKLDTLEEEKEELFKQIDNSPENEQWKETKRKAIEEIVQKEEAEAEDCTKVKKDMLRSIEKFTSNFIQKVIDEVKKVLDKLPSKKRARLQSVQTRRGLIAKQIPILKILRNRSWDDMWEESPSAT